MTPAIIVHMNRPETPCSATMPETTTTKAPGRPADLDARSAERRDDEAGDDRAVDAGLGREAGGDRKRHRERQRDQSDGEPGDEIVPEGGCGRSRAARGSTSAARAAHVLPMGVTLADPRA